MDYKQAIEVLEVYLENIGEEVDEELISSLLKINYLIEEHLRIKIDTRIIIRTSRGDLFRKLKDIVSNIDGFKNTNKEPVCNYSCRTWSDYSENYDIDLNGIYNRGQPKLIKEILEQIKNVFESNDDIYISVDDREIIFRGNAEDFDISKISI